VDVRVVLIDNGFEAPMPSLQVVVRPRFAIQCALIDTPQTGGGYKGSRHCRLKTYELSNLQVINNYLMNE